MRDKSEYKSWVFDCDGVILNSNALKTQAFYNTALPYGKLFAESLVKYHVLNGGVSRFKKFEYFLTSIVGKRVKKMEFRSLINNYSNDVKEKLLSAGVAEGLQQLRALYRDSRWFVASGGDQDELREIFNERQLANLFDGGIFGSPDSKDLIIEREVGKKNIEFPALFLGDSQYDHKVAKKAGLDFLFVSGWSELENWKEYTQKNGISSITSIKELIN